MTIENTAFTTAKIQTQKLISNILNFKKLTKDTTKFMAVIKADAYGHGALPLARVMEKSGEVDYFGVAQFSEALKLRKSGIQTNILVFNSLPPEAIVQAIENQIAFTVFTTDFAKQIVDVAQKLQKTAIVHLKIDTGMARLGTLDFQESWAVYESLHSPFVKVEGLYTHFADANELTATNFTEEQFKQFDFIRKKFIEKNIHFEIEHTCNTAATINFPEYHLDMVRVGFGLYGYNPTMHPEKIDLQPIQNIDATVTNIKKLSAGKSVGYDRTYYSSQQMKIATIAIGYADGIPLALSNQGHFTYLDKKLPIVGNVCMDQLMLDCSNTSDLQIGSKVGYFGDPKENYASLNQVAEEANTSPYELLCRIGDRVKRVYE